MMDKMFSVAEGIQALQNRFNDKVNLSLDLKLELDGESFRDVVELMEDISDALTHVLERYNYNPSGGALVFTPFTLKTFEDNFASNQKTLDYFKKGVEYVLNPSRR